MFAHPFFFGDILKLEIQLFSCFDLDLIIDLLK